MGEPSLQANESGLSFQGEDEVLGMEDLNVSRNSAVPPQGPGAHRVLPGKLEKCADAQPQAVG